MLLNQNSQRDTVSNIETRSASPGKPYHAPVVLSYGSIQAITQSRSCFGNRDNRYTDGRQFACFLGVNTQIRTRAS